MADAALLTNDASRAALEPRPASWSLTNMENKLRSGSLPYWQTKAAELRAVADRVPDPGTRESLLRMAEACEGLARGDFSAC